MNEHQYAARFQSFNLTQGDLDLLAEGLRDTYKALLDTLTNSSGAPCGGYLRERTEPNNAGAEYCKNRLDRIEALMILFDRPLDRSPRPAIERFFEQQVVIWIQKSSRSFL